MNTARTHLENLLAEIAAGPFTVARVCAEAGMSPSVVSRWKTSDIEPRMSSLERLAEAHQRLLTDREISVDALSQ